MTDEAPTAAEVEALIARLNNAPKGGCCEQAAAALAAQAQRIAELEATIKRERRQHAKDLAEESRASATEARWQERQGDDYGSY